MSALPSDDRRKLVGILGRLGSDAEGERAAAGLLATQLLARHGMGWADLFAPVAFTNNLANPKAARRAMYPDRAGSPERGEITREHQRTALRLLWSATEWSERETEFLSSMTERRDQSTDRQSAWLRDLEGKARRQRARREAVNA